MFETGIDIFRAAIAGVIFLYLRSMRGKGHFRFGKGWILILIGFGLIFFGALLDITDNFPGLNKYVIIGRVNMQSFWRRWLGTFPVSSLLRLVSGNGRLPLLPSEKKRRP